MTKREAWALFEQAVFAQKRGDDLVCRFAAAIIERCAAVADGHHDRARSAAAACRADAIASAIRAEAEGLKP